MSADRSLHSGLHEALQKIAGMEFDDNFAPGWHYRRCKQIAREALDQGGECLGAHDTGEMLWPGTAHQGVLCRRCKVFLPC